MSAQSLERKPILSSELVPFTELESLSRGVYILSNELNLLCGFAKGDQEELSSAAVKHIQNYVNRCFEPFADVSARFAIAAQDMGNKVIRVGAWSGTSAHDVTLKSAERICDLLWSHLDCDGYYSQFRSPPPKLRFDFCPNLVKEQWAKSKAVILGSGGLSDKWWAAFQDIPTLIEGEWARVSTSEQPPPADGEGATPKGKSCKGGAGRPSDTDPAEDQRVVNARPTAEAPPLDKQQIAVLRFLISRIPELCTIEVIVRGAPVDNIELSNTTVRKIVTELIENGYAERPGRGRKGVILTKPGQSLARLLAAT